MKIYLAGPMRGHPNWNFHVFDAAEARWREAGHRVFSPASIARAMNYPAESQVDREHLLHVIQSDLACIYAADAIALLPGWEKSTGATVELALAQFLNLPVYDADTMDQIFPIHVPWHDFNRVPSNEGDMWHSAIEAGEKRYALANS
jgi:nucleoside 2-deoxyribosyltransferase